MKRFGIVSYNIHCNFTNYGSALQSWAIQQAIDRLGAGKWQSVLLDYCPDVLRNKDKRNPITYMWDTDEKTRRMCALSLPAIRENADKFDAFYDTQFRKTKRTYTSENFDRVIAEEALDGFVCGSDTIFSIDEFEGFDDGYYANYPCMRGRSVAYAVSFGDSHFTRDSCAVLKERLQNFKMLGLREPVMLPFVANNAHVPVRRVLDPTLLLSAEDYAPVTAPRQEERPYLLLYARRHNPEMSAFAEKMAEEKGWEIVEISLWADNAERHRMFYEAGVEEFLSLVKYAQFVVTNSYHGMIFSIQFQRNFLVFTREQCDTKIRELLDLLGLAQCLMSAAGKAVPADINYADVEKKIKTEAAQSLHFLKQALETLY